MDMFDCNIIVVCFRSALKYGDSFTWL
jgi:hypothetical protein